MNFKSAALKGVVYALGETCYPTIGYVREKVPLGLREIEDEPVIEFDDEALRGFDDDP